MKKLLITLLIILFGFSMVFAAEIEPTEEEKATPNEETLMTEEPMDQTVAPEQPIELEVAGPAEEMPEAVEEMPTEKLPETAEEMPAEVMDVPSVNIFKMFASIQPAPAKDGIDHYIDSAINFIGYNNTVPANFGIAFGPHFGGFDYSMGVNAFYTMTFSNGFGACARINMDIGGGRFGLLLGGVYNLVEKDNYILSINAGPSLMFGSSFFQLGIDAIASYSFFLSPKWYIKASAPIELVFYRKIFTTSIGGFSVGILLPSISIGYKL